MLILTETETAAWGAEWPRTGQKSCVWPWFLHWGLWVSHSPQCLTVFICTRRGLASRREVSLQPNALFLLGNNVRMGWGGNAFFQNLVFPLTSLQWEAERDCQYLNTIFPVHINFKMYLTNSKLGVCKEQSIVSKIWLLSFLLSFFSSLPSSPPSLLPSFAFKRRTPVLWLRIDPWWPQFLKSEI